MDPQTKGPQTKTVLWVVLGSLGALLALFLLALALLFLSYLRLLDNVSG